MLCGWPDATALPNLLQLAEKSTDSAQPSTGVAGIGAAGRRGPRHPADIEQLARGLTPADRVQESGCCSGPPGAFRGTRGSHRLGPAAQRPGRGPEASLAAVMIAERAGKVDDPAQRDIITGVMKQAKDPALRERAKKVRGPGS